MSAYIIIIPVIILSAWIFSLTGSFQKKKKKDVRHPEEDYEIGHLCEYVKTIVNERIEKDHGSLKLSEGEVVKRRMQQARLRNAAREACLGDSGDREFIRDYIREILQKDMGVTPDTICRIFSFDEPEKMSAGELFGYLYSIYTRVHGIHVFGNLVKDFGWNEGKDGGPGNTTISESLIRSSFDMCMFKPCYQDRLDMVVQRIYEKLYGHDAADILINDPDIDGVSGGTGGRTRREYNYLEELFGPQKAEEADSWDTIYCVYRGKLLHMSFLSFGREENLERVVKNIYRYNARSSLSKRNPILQSSLKNNSRVVVARPPVSDGWVFYVRKFSSSNAADISSLITDKGSEMVISFLKKIVEDELNFVVSGNTGGGKTTLVKSLIDFINPSYALRIIETTFELNINNLYPDRNVHVMQERGDFTIYDAIAASKKMDTDVLILGEVNEPKVAGAFVQVAQSGSRMAITTLHHETTQKLIEYLRNALVCEWGINDTRIAERQVVDCINYDIHMVHDVTGHHYIERITRIIPEDTEKIYRLENVIVYNRDKGEYEMLSGQCA